MLEIFGLSKSFTIGSHEVPIFSEFDLTLDADKVLCILGPSGCGKTTLARIMAGLDLEHSGRVLFKGNRIIGPSPERILLMQDLALFEWMTVAENVGLGLKLRGVPITEIGRKVVEILEFVALSKFADLYPRQLSGGMKQRVAIARSLILNPSLMILDEPFSSLDELTKQSIIALIFKIRTIHQLGICLITHNITEAAVLADRIVVLSGASPTRIKNVISSPVHGSFEERRELFFADRLDLKATIFESLVEHSA